MDDVMINPGQTTDPAEAQAAESSAAETPPFDESDDSECRTTFQYMPLESSSNSIRLAVLEPNRGNHNSEIKCRITHTTFGAKPVYEALSYTWGDETLKRTIKIDGCHFAVSNNLYEAVSHLRNPWTERTFWIDAISINQMDTDEKNNQIRMMPFIYKRAESVVVWLGSGLDFDPIYSEYWKKLWVIQEFGMARRLVICWAKETRPGGPRLLGFESDLETYKYPWDELGFQTMGPHAIDTGLLPLNANVLKFKRLRETKYLGNRLLRNLLRDHQDAKCKDPRDKVYGLVGLSTDCFRQLPMDYRKTLWEVYKDVVTFYVLDPELLELSKLLRSLIGGPDKISPRDVEKEKVTDVLELVLVDPTDPTTIKIHTGLIGMIIHLGPSYNEIMSSFEDVSDWEAAIKRVVSKPSLGQHLEQSDLFLEDLERISEEALEARLSSNQTIYWDHIDNREERDLQVYRVESMAKLSTNEHSRTSSRLFLIHGKEADVSETSIGFACEGAEPGDLVFQVPNHDLAMVVRDRGSCWMLVGYAGMAMTAERRKKTGRPQKNSKGLFNIADSNTWIGFKVCLDMATLYNISD